mmetsp:Transcript_1277/g.2977  ORF Transcript_1277/g.2977 Transcript_1277/m.2977 type:complete len:106 (-) Transcript_1277:88-405(-)
MSAASTSPAQGEGEAKAGANDSGEEFPFKQVLEIKLPSVEDADTVFRVMNVDKEVRPDRIQRTIRLDAPTIHLAFAATEIRHLRVAVSSFLQSMSLVVDTIVAFK